MGQGKILGAVLPVLPKNGHSSQKCKYQKRIFLQNKLGMEVAPPYKMLTPLTIVDT